MWQDFLTQPFIWVKNMWQREKCGCIPALFPKYSKVKNCIFELGIIDWKRTFTQNFLGTYSINKFLISECPISNQIMISYASAWNIFQVAIQMHSTWGKWDTWQHTLPICPTNVPSLAANTLHMHMLPNNHNRKCFTMIIIISFHLLSNSSQILSLCNNTKQIYFKDNKVIFQGNFNLI